MQVSVPRAFRVLPAFVAVLMLAAALLAATARTARAADPVIAVSGDIACSPSSSNFNGGAGTADRCRMKYTSDLLVNAGLSAVLTTGDLQYDTAKLSSFQQSYDPTWGRVKSITRPSAGNHEYKGTPGTGYYDYFNGVGNATGLAGDRDKGYYAFNVGTWRLYALNSTDKCTIIPCGTGSAQEQWLKADLAANSSKYCTLAYAHAPRFNSGFEGNATYMDALFQALYNADAEILLGGHAHDYERFAPQNPSGQLDNARGIRQFVIGTGGSFFTSMSSAKPNSQIRQNNTYGVLMLTLRPTSYDWQFVSESNKPFTDSGTAQCHGSSPPPPTDTTKPSAPGNLQATASEGQVALNWNASTDNVGVTGYRVYRGGTEIASIGVTASYTDTTVAGSTTYSYTVRATDAAGNLSDPSNTATATTPATTTFTYAPEADAEVEASAPTTNYATAKLRTDAGSTAAETFLRFTVGGVGGNVQSAKLRLHAYTGTADGPAVYTVSNTWSETTVNWNTRPTATSAARDDKGAITSNTWVEWDVTPFVTGNGTFSFRLAQAASDGVDYRSREYTSNRPELVVTTSADSQKPSPPGNLQATGSASQVALSWQPSSDNVGVTGYRAYRGTTQIATLGSTATSYTDTGLAPGPYSYTVRAVDAAGNVSDPSNTANATVPDTTKPSPPGNLTASAGAGQVALSWSASSDNVGVTGYRVYRGTNQIASLGASATTYTDGGLAPGPYSYTVRAIDAAGNLSDPSNTASATVLDSTKPSAPAGLTATAGAGQVALGWNASNDDVGVTGYRIYRGTDWIASVPGGTTSFTDTGLAPGPYSYTVRATDAAGNLSDPSNSASATVPDTTKPSAPSGLGATAANKKVTLNWGASSDDVAVTAYRIYRGGTQIDSVGAGTTSYVDNNLAPGTYDYVVRALDGAGNLSDPSNTASATVQDTTKPNAPANLSASASPRQVALDWDAATDDVGVTAYEVYRGSTKIATVGAAAAAYTDTDLAAGDYTYTVMATDAAANVSDPSNVASATVPDTTPPATPANLSATPSGNTQVDLTWDESTDDVAVSGYRVFRDDQEVATVTGTSYSDVVLPGTYTYTVRAFDAAGNRSDPSNSDTATVSPPDLIPPAAPGNLAATPSNGSQVDLTWDAATDDVGVTAYEIYRDDGLIATTDPATSFADTVPPGSYTYTVRALDAAGNRSDPSNTASATVDDTSAPSAPANLVATVAGPLRIDLSWEAAADNLAVTEYRVYRDGNLLATLGPATSYTDDLATPETHTYEVRALDAAGNASDPSNSATADLEAPAAPTGATATLSAPGQVDVTWDAASDDVGVTGYRVYRDGDLLAETGAVTSYTDTNVPPGTYSYTVRALDAAGNLSDEGDGAGVTVPDTTAPSAPGNLTVTAELGQVELSWDAAGDDVGVTAYEVYREDTLIATLGAATSYTDTGLATGAYGYAVRALDAAGNRSDPSNTATGTVPDTTAPSAPSNLVATGGAGQVTLSWDPASDDAGVTGYRLYRDGAPAATLGPVTSHTDAGLQPGTYTSEVRALDAAGNLSDPSNAEAATVTDGERPSAPGNLTATAVSSSQIDLAWDAATDNVAVTGYEIWRDGNLLATIATATSYSDGVLAPATHTYQVRALDAAGNRSDPSNQDTATVTPPDAEPPSKPAGLVASGAPGQVSLSWQASLDDLAVTGYRIYRDGNLLAEIGAETSYTDTPLAPGDYTYAVQALDGAGHVSDPSDPATATVPDVERPSAPAGLQAAGAGTGQVTLSWQASSDDVGVTGYRVYRGTEEIATIGATTSFTDTGRPPGTYSYTVRAEDAAGNLSDPSNTATATIAAPATSTILPDADAEVNAGAATTNYATAKLRTDGGSTPEDSFLRFTVSGVAGPVQSATLRLFVYTGTADGPALYSTTNAWTETTLTWNNRPPRTSAATGDKGAIASNTWAEWDVTQFVTGNGTFSFTLAQTASDGIDFRSREYTTNPANRPQLVVTTG